VQTLLMDVDEPFCPLHSGELIVESGVVWLTEYGNSTDVFLRTGQRVSVLHSRRPIIQSMAEGTRLSFHRAGVLAQLKDLWSGIVHALGGHPGLRPHLEN